MSQDANCVLFNRPAWGFSSFVVFNTSSGSSEGIRKPIAGASADSQRFYRQLTETMLLGRYTYSCRFFLYILS